MNMDIYYAQGHKRSDKLNIWEKLDKTSSVFVCMTLPCSLSLLFTVTGMYSQDLVSRYLGKYISTSGYIIISNHHTYNVVATV